MEIKKTFFINLKRRRDRLLYFNKNILNKLDINSNFEVIDAVDGRNIQYTDEMLSTINPWNIVNKKPKSFGVIGCCLSHLNIYKKLDYSDNDIYLIFEDDVMFAKNIDNPIKYICNLTFPNDWGIIYLNGDFRNRSAKSRDAAPKPVSFPSSVMFTAESYLIKGSCAKELLDFNIKFGLGAIDAHMEIYFRNSNFKQYSIDPPIFKQNSNLNTDIQRIDYLPIFKKCHGFVINLKRRPDRLAKFKLNYKETDVVDLHTKKAVDGKGDDTRIASMAPRVRLSKGEIGCFLSHYEIWKYMTKIGLPFCIIYEDDVQFTDNYNFKLNKLLKNLPTDFHVCYIGGRFKKNHVSKDVINVSENIVKHENVYPIKNGADLDRTAHAYIISLQAARNLCSEFEENFNPDILPPLDHFIIKYLLTNDFDILNSQPLLCWSELNGDSDIRDKRGIPLRH
tara:strand:+ start:8788 stop:10137 length:1350 start_codon:yes stop_codon:yes gene_type:complete